MSERVAIQVNVAVVHHHRFQFLNSLQKVYRKEGPPASTVHQHMVRPLSPTYRLLESTRPITSHHFLHGTASFNNITPLSTTRGPCREVAGLEFSPEKRFMGGVLSSKPAVGTNRLIVKAEPQTVSTDTADHSE